MKKIKLNPKYIFYLIIALCANFAMYFGVRFFMTDAYHYNLTTAFDRSVPFIPATVLIYNGCYLFWALNYYLSMKNDGRGGLRFLSAHLLGDLICCFFFVLFPTAMVRPEITGTSAFSRILKLTYIVDKADNLFPSLHCFASWLSLAGVRDKKTIPTWYKWASLFMALAVCVSTLTVKQHVIADVFSGVLLAELTYYISGLIPFPEEKTK